MVGTRETFCIFDYKRCLESVFLKNSFDMFAQYFLEFVTRIRTQFVRTGLGQGKPPSLPPLVAPLRCILFIKSVL